MNPQWPQENAIAKLEECAALLRHSAGIHRGILFQQFPSLTVEKKEELAMANIHQAIQILTDLKDFTGGRPSA